MVEQSLLDLRKRSKTRKPTFLRQDAHRNKSLEKKWRKPKGMHSKMRLHHKGKRTSPSPGYGAPRLVKGLTKNGLQEVFVQTLHDLKDFNPKTQIIVFRKIGLRKKLALLKHCMEKKYSVSNIKDPSYFIQKVELELVGRKKKHTEEQKKKVQEESSEKSPHTQEEKKEELTALSEKQEETKKGEKSDKIKVLEKRK